MRKAEDSLLISHNVQNHGLYIYRKAMQVQSKDYLYFRHCAATRRGGLAGGLAYYFTRPEDIPVTAAQADAQSLPSLVQASESGAVRIDSSHLLADPSNVAVGIE